MGGYLVNFSVYTMAMIGLIFFALMIYKKFSGMGILDKKSEFLKVEETLNIAPRKNLYVIRAGNEKFLIAGDSDKTTLISKLGIENGIYQTSTGTNEVVNMHTKSSVGDLPDITVSRIRKTPANNVLHNMVRKINQ